MHGLTCLLYPLPHLPPFSLTPPAPPPPLSLQHQGGPASGLGSGGPLPWTRSPQVCLPSLGFTMHLSPTRLLYFPFAWHSTLPSLLPHLLVAFVPVYTANTSAPGGRGSLCLFSMDAFKHREWRI